MSLPEPLRMRLESDPKLPSLPPVVEKILALWRHTDDPDPDAVARVVARDPTLAAKIVTYANSAEIAPAAPVLTVRQSIGMLGTRRTRNAALTFTLLPLRARQGESFRLFWRRALLSSIVARHLAPLGRWAPNIHPEEAALVALLQDIGSLVLMIVLRDEYQRLVVDSGHDHAGLVERERIAIGADHAEVGAWLLFRWRMPDALVSAVHGSHEASSPPHGAGSMADLIANAGVIADYWVDERPVAQTGEFGPLNEDDPVRTALAQAGQEIASVSDLLKVDVQGPRDLRRLAAEARSLLNRTK